MPKLIEYKVRPVTRYVVTRFEDYGPESNKGGASETNGEFDNAQTAYAVAYALCRTEHEQLGWPVGDERIQYPRAVLTE
jgi:hypothetical protein